MQSSLITLLAFGFVLGVLIFVHELGHFLAAKRVGIRVLKFQLGFNPTIASVTRGGTEYSLGLLPLGGYVKMAGDNPDETRTGGSDEFLSKTKWERFQVLIMGPVMNLLLAVVVTAFVLYSRGIEEPVYLDQAPIVGSVVPDSPAAKSDIQPDDQILTVAGRAVDTWRQLRIAIGTRANREIPITFQHQGREIERKVTPLTPPGQSRFEIGDIGVLPRVHPQLQAVTRGGPGDQGGLKTGDVVVAVDREPMARLTQFQDAIASRADRVTTVSVVRAGKPLDLTVTPGHHESTRVAHRGQVEGWLDVGLVEETRSLKPGMVEAVEYSVQTNVESAGLIFQTVWGLITRETSPKQLMGPVAIAQVSGEVARLGLIPLLSLMAAISLNLGLLNLLPIPILDGGHIFIMALEGLARRDFSARLKEKMLLAGFVVLMTLMVTVIYNDLTRVAWIERLMPWR